MSITHDSQRFEEIENDGDARERPRRRSGIATGRSRLHFQTRIESEPGSRPEDPTPREE